MAQVAQKVYINDSDDYRIFYKETETSKRKKAEKAKYDIEPIKEFITEYNRKRFGHLCSNCKNQKYCDKWFNKIILFCENLNSK